MGQMLFVFEKMIPTVQLLKEKYCSQNAFKCAFKSILDVTEDDLSQSNVIVFVRPSDPLSLRLAQTANQSGVFTVFYTDDDLLHLPKTHPLSENRRKRLLKIARQCKVVLSGNLHICKSYAPFTMLGKYVLSTPSVDYLDDDAILHNLSKVDTLPVKIVYAAGSDHVNLFYKYIEPILSDLDFIYKDKISFDFIGVAPKIDKERYHMAISEIPGMPLNEYREYMASQHYDIGLAPLEDTLFNRSKYFNKYLEYTAMGIPGLYSNVEPYTNVICQYTNGILVDNEPIEWRDSLVRLIDNQLLRKEILRNAYAQVNNDFTTESFTKNILNDIPAIVYNPAERKPVKPITLYKKWYKFYRIYDILLLGFFYLRNGNFSKLACKIKEKLCIK